MMFRTAAPRRLLAGLATAVLATVLIAPTSASAGVTDPDLLVTLELDDGNIEYRAELDTLHFFDEENQPFAVEVIDGCALNDHLWVFGAGLSGIPAPLAVTDLNTGKSVRLTLPPFEPGKPIGTMIEPEALAVCGEDAQVGGLPPLEGVATFTSANARGQDDSDIITLLSDGRDNAYGRLLRGRDSLSVVSKGAPVAAVDESSTTDQLYLIAESRTPRQLEGIVFSGAQGMIPVQGALGKALKGLTNARVRRAYETAKNGRVPQAIIEDLGLKRVDRVHHMSLDFDTLGAAAYLAAARWIKEGGAPIEPPSVVDERFTVELVAADGARDRLPLMGPFVGSDAAGQRWEYASKEALVRITDACSLGGTFWIWAGALTDEPLELAVTDTTDGTSASLLVWTDRRDVSRTADSAALVSCP